MHQTTPEADRLERLGNLAILDSAPDSRFDRLAEIVRRTFNVPIAAISFVSGDRKWFKAQRGLPLEQMPRQGSFCDHTIRSDSVFVVEDTCGDERFAGNPIVSGHPYVRFYAGAPLALAPGLRVGALCVMSDCPRRFDWQEQRLLQLLAEDTCEQIHRHALQHRLDEELERGAVQNQRLLVLSEELARKDKVARQVYRIARIGGWELDVATQALNWSDEVYALLDVDRDFPLDLHAAIELIFEEHRKTALDAVQRAAESGEAFEIEVPVRTKSGSARWFRVLAETDADGAERRLFGTVQDVTARREIEAELRRVATTDSLTGLPNRSSFTKAVEGLSGEGTREQPIALLILDLDGFKDVNDTFGHDAGDRLLTVIAGRLKSCLRSDDIVGRLGGDEFGVLLRAKRSIVEVASMARLMLEAATASVPYHGHTLHVGASVGIALFPNDTSDAAALMKRADAALYSVKRAGGDCFQFYSKELGAEAENRAILLRDVRAALSAAQFTAAYQPIVNLRDGKLAGLEVLLRWDHPERGFLPAAEFIAALDEPNLGRLLSDEARDIAVEQLASWRRDGLEVGRLGLNVSIGQLRDAEFSDRLLEALSARGLDPSDVTLEITEGVLLGRGSEHIARRIRTLHDAGACIALDDFGTGYASLTHLRQFPVDVLKIDASFVRSMASVDANRTIVKTVIDMAHGLGMRVVAEGVEDRETDAVLKLMGCEAGQGYFYGAPVRADKVPAFLSAGIPATFEPVARAG